jgi:hypothetical protein
MFNAADLDGIVVRMNEKKPVIANAKAQFLIVTLQGFQIANTRLHKSVQGMKDAHCSGLIESPHIGLGLISPNDLLQAESR